MFGFAIPVCIDPIPDVTVPAPTPVSPACVIPAFSKALIGAT